MISAGRRAAKPDAAVTMIAATAAGYRPGPDKTRAGTGTRTAVTGSCDSGGREVTCSPASPCLATVGLVRVAGFRCWCRGKDPGNHAHDHPDGVPDRPARRMARSDARPEL